MLRFLIVFLFFILVVTITVKQIRVSTAWDGTVWNGTTSDGTAIFWNGTAWDGNTLSPEQQEALRQAIHPRYLEGWKPVFYAAIVMGLGLVLYELAQMTYSPSKYFMYVRSCRCCTSGYVILMFFSRLMFSYRSPYNYIDLAAYICPVVGSFIFLSNEEGEIDEDTGIDGGPSMIWAMGFGILFLYLNMVRISTSYHGFCRHTSMALTSMKRFSYSASSYLSCESLGNLESWSTSSSTLRERSNGSSWSFWSSL